MKMLLDVTYSTVRKGYKIKPEQVNGDATTKGRSQDKSTNQTNCLSLLQINK